MDPQLSAVRDSTDKAEWDARLNLFEKYSQRTAVVPVAAIPHDCSHFRSAQLWMIFKTLGIKRPITHLKRHPQQIDRMVDNRNSIAHGAETAAEIGRNYTPD